MAQHDLTIANGNGATVRADIEAALQALGSTMKGGSAPSSPFAGMLWWDDNTPSSSVWTLFAYDGADWIALGTLDTTNNLFTPANIGWQVISRTTLANPTAAAVIALPSGFKRFRLEMDFVSLSASAQIAGRISTDGGATYANGASDYSPAGIRNTGTSGVAGDGAAATFFGLSAAGAAAATVIGHLECTVSGGFRYVVDSSVLNAAGTAYERFAGGGVRNSASTPTHLQLLPTAGNFTGGELVLLGRT